MIDPDSIMIQKAQLPSTIDIKSIPEFDTITYNLEDEKDFDHYIKDIEKDVRRSFEYRRFINYIRDNMDMDRCSFLQGVTNEETFDIKIEIHHYPFTLRDIVEIVYRKRNALNESLDLHMVSKEVMELHYKLMIGLIPLSETVHELCHAGRLFIPVDKVMGRYNMFVDYYKPYCSVGQLETLERIEKYTREEVSEVLDTTIIEQNKVTYDIDVPQYQLPEFGKVSDEMIHKLESIKQNNYLLPTIKDIEDKSKYVCPIIFMDGTDGRNLH